MHKNKLPWLYLGWLAGTETEVSLLCIIVVVVVVGITTNCCGVLVLVLLVASISSVIQVLTCISISPTREAES